MLSCFITSQIVYADDTDDKCYSLLKHVCYMYECYRDKVYTGHAFGYRQIHYHMGYNHRLGMVDAIYGSL